VFTDNNFAQLDYPSDQFFKGLGLNTGIGLANKWTFNLGFTMMYLDQVKINKFTFQTEEHQIERIDTTIKYNINYDRLMMQFDTVMSYKNVNHESSSVYKNNILIITLPLQARYHIGNEKRSMYASFGVTGTLIHQSQSLAKNVGLANENTQINNDYSFLFAPTVGLGFHQRIYRAWAFHLASNYSKYLNSNLNQSNTLQLQTGLKYNF
jgi:opacity protein-like surface antigen